MRLPIASTMVLIEGLSNELFGQGGLTQIVSQKQLIVKRKFIKKVELSECFNPVTNRKRTISSLTPSLNTLF